MFPKADPFYSQPSRVPLTKLLKEGGLSFTIILSVIALILSSFEYHFFSTWAVFIFMCGVPLQLVMTMQMQTDYPRVIAVMRQPVKGMLMTLFTIAIALVIAAHQRRAKTAEWKHAGNRRLRWKNLRDHRGS